jgi:hypothetical protein
MAKWDAPALALTLHHCLTEVDTYSKCLEGQLTPLELADKPPKPILVMPVYKVNVVSIRDAEIYT